MQIRKNKLYRLKITSSLIIATYNWPAALRLCLESVKHQTIMPGEIIIADDGSGSETREVVDQFSKQFPIPVKHIWQPDEGYQLARIRNKAFAAASGAYLLQIDGDLILHPQFVKDHLDVARPGTFVSGARSLINKEMTERLLNDGKFTYANINQSALGKKYNARRIGMLSRLYYLFQRGHGQVNYVLGCNMAFWKEDLFKVNGYNEEFSGWGREDNDIAVRLLNAGVELRFLKFGGIVYHLFHKETPRPGFSINEELFRKSLNKKTTFVPQGMNQYISL